VVGGKDEGARCLGPREAGGRLLAQLLGDGERRGRWRLGAGGEREGKREGEGSDDAMAAPHRRILCLKESAPSNQPMRLIWRPRAMGAAAIGMADVKDPLIKPFSPSLRAQRSNPGS
jgi:hypothetical protein